MDSRTEKLKSCLADFRETPEACMLINYRSRETRFTFDDRMSVTRSIEKAFAPVFLEMRVESPSLSESDLIYCALIAAGFKSEVIADCISISKESLRMRKIRVKEKLSPFWVGILFPETDATKSCDNVAQQNLQADEPAILLRQNQSNSKVMETKEITLGKAIKLGFKNCFKFSGRASRTEFWYFVLFYTIVIYTLGFGIAFAIPFLNRCASIAPYTGLAIVCILSIVLLIPLLGITVRRLHDTERKGLWILPVLIPQVLYLISLTCLTFFYYHGIYVVEQKKAPVTELTPEQRYNRYTDMNGDTIKFYPDYLPQILSGERFFYYKADGDSIVVDPGIFKTAEEVIGTQEVNREQKMFYKSVGVAAVLLLFMFVSFIILVIFCAQPGTVGPNAYGSEPK